MAGTKQLKTYDLVRGLYRFDAKLRHVVSGELAAVELAVRALLGHELGRIDPFVHLDADLLGALSFAKSLKQLDQHLQNFFVRSRQETCTPLNSVADAPDKQIVKWEAEAGQSPRPCNNAR